MPLHVIVPLDADLFYWIHENFGLLLVLDERSGGHQGHLSSPSGHCGNLYESISRQYLNKYFTKKINLKSQPEGKRCSCINNVSKTIMCYQNYFKETFSTWLANHVCVNLQIPSNTFSLTLKYIYINRLFKLWCSYYILSLVLPRRAV